MASRKYALRRRVVIDGPLIIHGGAGGVGVDGRRLVSAFQWYEKLGYSVEATISNRKYIEFTSGKVREKVGNEWVKKKRKPIVGAASLRRLFREGKLFKFRGDDDKVMLDKCLEKGNEAWIITHDKFDDIQRQAKVIKRQRSKYPNLDWEEIDEFTRGTINSNGQIFSNKHWYVEGKDFYDHEMPPAPPKVLFGKFSEIRALSNELTFLLANIDALLENLDGKTIKQMRLIINRIHKQAALFIDEIPEEEFDLEEVSALSVPDLRKLAKAGGLSGYSRLKKRELIDLIMNDTKKELVEMIMDDTPESPVKKKKLQSQEIVKKFIHVLEREIASLEQSNEREVSFPKIGKLAKEVKDEFGIGWSPFLSCFNYNGSRRLDDRIRGLLSHIEMDYKETRRDGIDYAIFN